MIGRSHKPVGSWYTRMALKVYLINKINTSN